MTIVSKACSMCKQTKPLDEFYSNKSTQDGKTSRCKVCMKEYARQWQLKNPKKAATHARNYRVSEKGKAAERKSQQTPRGQEARRRYLQSGKGKAALARRDKRYLEKNKDKRRVWQQAHKAVRLGEIPKLDKCENCGSDNHVHMHHADYSKPLVVVWLCAKCHRKADRERIV